MIPGRVFLRLRSAQPRVAVFRFTAPREDGRQASIPFRLNVNDFALHRARVRQHRLSVHPRLSLHRVRPHDLAAARRTLEQIDSD